MNLLIIRLSALGDVAMLVPVVKALASQHSDIKITVLSVRFLQPLFEGIADNVHFIAFDKKGEHKGFAGLNRLFRQLQAEHFTHIADCHDVLRTKYLRLRFRLQSSALFGKMPRIASIDKHREGKRALTRDENKLLVQQPTSFENYAETIDKVLGINLIADVKNQRSAAEGKVNAQPNYQLSIINYPFKIGIAPFAAHPGKIYPLDKTFEVIRLLLARGCKIFLFGAGEKEMAVFHEWLKVANNNDNLLIASDILKAEGRKGIGEEVKLMGELDVMLTMDSGNQHLAALSGTRVVSVWGATHPLAGFLAWQQSEEDCVQLDMPCRPCSIYGNKPCKYGAYPCLKNISPEDIVNKINLSPRGGQV